ncbi:MAG: cation diffusion facilitator family transporter [Muribaculaceae bacterium]|nr:cation diffusion facilitator family transporter [Muribaculaceae bacterium]
MNPDKPEENVAQEEIRVGKHVTWIGFWTNMALSVLKILAGVIGRSSAMIADGIHSASDLITDIAVVLVLGVSRKKADSSHSYGHGKIETFVTFIIALLLAAVGIGILVDGVKRAIAFFEGESISSPTWIALAMAIVSILAKEWLFRFTRKAARRIHSPAMEANAWHHRSDAFSSLATLAGIAGAMFLGPGWRFLDPLAAALVSVLIITMAVKMARTSVRELLEASLPASEAESIRQIILSTPGVRDYHHFRSRSNGNTRIIDFHIKLDPDITLRRAHDIATTVENAIKENFSPAVVNIHMEPYTPEQ